MQHALQALTRHLTVVEKRDQQGRRQPQWALDTKARSGWLPLIAVQVCASSPGSPPPGHASWAASDAAQAEDNTCTELRDTTAERPVCRRAQRWTVVFKAAKLRCSFGWGLPAEGLTSCH